MNQPHRIRTLRFDLRAAQPEGAFRLRQAVAATVQSPSFVQGLEALLDRLAPGSAEYRIEKLEVPMDGLTPEAWERDGTARLLAALETALGRELHQTTPNAAPGQRGSFSENGEETTASARRGSETWLDAFGWFLQTGRLPWWAGAEALAPETVRAELLRWPSDQLETRLAAVLAQPDAARRLVWQVEPKSVFALLERLSGTEVVRRIRAHEAEWVRRFRTRKLPAETLRERLETGRVAWVQALAGRAWRADAAWLEAEIRRLDEADGSGSTTGLRVPPAGPESLPANESSPIQPPAASRTEPVSDAATSDVSTRDFLAGKNARTAAGPGVSPEAEASFFIANAGLVLLHPFVAPLLAELGFLEKGRFRSEKHQHRAVHLLAHLVGQKSFSTETELLLPKLLLGLPPEAPVRRRVRLSRTEKAEARELLEAVVEHWSVLKSTSAVALQGEFLQREGRLEHRDDAWHLTVEQRTSDVLLGYLPWGISLVRLPWMVEWLHVTWA